MYFYDISYCDIIPKWDICIYKLCRLQNPIRPRKNTAEGGVGGIPPRPRGRPEFSDD